MKNIIISKMIQKEKMTNIGQKWAFVVGAYLKDYSAKLSASEISKITGIERKSVSRILNNLVNLNLVNYNISGRNKLFYFDLENPKTKILFEVAENQKSLEFFLKNKEVFLIINDLLGVCSSVVVFGSFASSKHHKKSDLDLVVFGCKNKKKIREIKENYLLEINEHPFSYDEFQKILNKKVSLSLEVMGNHILFGDVSQIVNIFLRVKNG